MSIVEKAVGRDSGSNRSAKQAKGSSSNVRGDSSDGWIPSEDCIKLENLTDRGLLAIAEDSELSRAFRFIKRAVLAKIFGSSHTGDLPGKVIMITSAMPDSGKSSIAFNLSVSIAQEQSMNVVLIDADTVRHSLSTILGLRDSEGLLEALSSHNTKIGTIPTDLPCLRFVPAGQTHSNATELLASASMSRALAALAEPDTIVVLDTTPMLISSEADAVSAHADHTIVVVEAGATSADEVDSTLKVLSKSGSPVSFIVNGLKSRSSLGTPGYYDELY